jgi:hypothetical protein
MADIVLTGDTSGSITVAAPAVAGTNTLTLPAETGTIVTSTSAATNTPAFSVKLSDIQSISETTATKIQFDSKDLDTDNAFNTSTYEFTVPTGKAGAYSFNLNCRLVADTNTTVARALLYIYKNGAAIKRAYNYFSTNYIRANSLELSAILNLAEGDEICGYAYIDTTDNAGADLNSLTYTYFDGHKLIT